MNNEGFILSTHLILKRESDHRAVLPVNKYLKRLALLSGSPVLNDNRTGSEIGCIRERISSGGKIRLSREILYSRDARCARLSERARREQTQ
jgi:hypothetical protein